MGVKHYVMLAVVVLVVMFIVYKVDVVRKFITGA
jgi:hypothetical protein